MFQKFHFVNFFKLIIFSKIYLISGFKYYSCLKFESDPIDKIVSEICLKPAGQHKL